MDQGETGFSPTGASPHQLLPPRAAPVVPVGEPQAPWAGGKSLPMAIPSDPVLHLARV